MPDVTTSSIDPDYADGTPPSSASCDFASLRQRGLAYLQHLAGDTWTDHNAHDPGITILEQLCYVLTDLAYRANFDMRDLLAGTGPTASLFRASEILPTEPVTLLDLRKIVLDIDGVKNAWLEPVVASKPLVCFDPAANALSLDAAPPAGPVMVRGVYRVLVAPDRGGPDPAGIARRLHASRPLDLDFLEPEILQEQKIGVIAEIEVDHTRQPSEVLRSVYRTALDYVSPGVRFYRLDEMLTRGLELGEIFDGPLLRHGFIDSDELARTRRPTELHTSDLLALLMQIDGVRAVHQLGLKKEGEAAEPWVLALEPSQTPALDLSTTAITLVRGRVRWNPTTDEINRVTDVVSQTDVSTPLQLADFDPPIPAGTTRDVRRYHSLQHHLPQVYGLGMAGLPASATAARQAQARQLRAYLMMFDQVLANGFSQLAHARELFSSDSPTGLTRTYFGQQPTDVPGADEILPASFDADALQTLLETPENAAARQQRFLDHMLARFAEDFGGYALQSEVLRRTPAERMEPQRAFLRDYPAASGGLGRAFDYTRPSWGEAHSANVSGLEKRVAYKLGISRYFRRALADLPPDDEGGFHFLEHILLRPGPADADGGDSPVTPPFLAQPLTRDPYSAQVSFLFPGWVAALGGDPDTGFQNPRRDYVEKTVREETPAHLRVRVRWLTRDEMAAFEPAYRTWLDGMVTPLP